VKSIIACRLRPARDSFIQVRVKSVLTDEAEAENLTTNELIARLMSRVPVP
jgi:hypothetical protein